MPMRFGEISMVILGETYLLIIIKKHIRLKCWNEKNDRFIKPFRLREMTDAINWANGKDKLLRNNWPKN